MGVSNPSTREMQEKQPELLLGAVSVLRPGQSAGSPRCHLLPLVCFYSKLRRLGTTLVLGTGLVERSDGRVRSEGRGPLWAWGR